MMRITSSTTKNNNTKYSSFRSVLVVAATASALALCSLSPAEARIGTNSAPERRLVPADEEDEDSRYDFRQEIVVNTGFLENADGVSWTRSEPVKMEITIGDIPDFAPDANYATDEDVEGSDSA